MSSRFFGSVVGAVIALHFGSALADAVPTLKASPTTQTVAEGAASSIDLVVSNSGDASLLVADNETVADAELSYTIHIRDENGHVPQLTPKGRAIASGFVSGEFINLALPPHQAVTDTFVVSDLFILREEHIYKALFSTTAQSGGHWLSVKSNWVIIRVE